MSFRAVRDVMPQAMLAVVPPEEEDSDPQSYVEHLVYVRSMLVHEALAYLDGPELHRFFIHRQWHEDDLYSLGVMTTALNHPEADFGMALWFLIMIEANYFLTRDNTYSLPEYVDAVRGLIRQVIDRANAGGYPFALYDTHTSSGMISDYRREAPESCRLDAAVIRAAHAHVKTVAEHEARKPKSGLDFDDLVRTFANLRT